MVSVAAAMLAFRVRPELIALTGFVPLALGLDKLWQLKHPGAAPDVNRQEQPGAATLQSQVLAVSTVTVANGGDNLGVYIPVFGSRPSALPIFAAVFVAMTAIWCCAGYMLVRHPLGGRAKAIEHDIARIRSGCAFMP